MRVSNDEMLLRARVAHLEHYLRIAMDALQFLEERAGPGPSVAKSALDEIRKHQTAVRSAAQRNGRL